MSGFKGSKGYWEQNRYCVFAGENEEIGKNVICRLHHGLNNYMGNEQPYNAQLISHAPQMLEMLKGNLAYMEELGMMITSEKWTEEFRTNWNAKTNALEQLIQQATTIK